MRTILVGLALCAGMAYSQISSGGITGASGSLFNFGSSTSMIVPTGTGAAPGTCTVGTLYFRSATGTPASSLSVCDPTNTYTAIGAPTTSLPLSSLTAAVAGTTLANGDNAQVWNWALTTNSKTAFTFGETTAATGTSNVLHQITTLSTSTAVPLQVTEGSGPAAAAAPLALNVTGGVGGANAGATNPGFKGGGVTFTTGAGSNAGATSGTGGAGGDINLTGGAGGTAAVASTTGAGGNIILTPGAAGGTGTAGAAGNVQIVGPTVAGANTTPFLSITGTWNTTGFANGLLMNVTNSASGSQTNMMDLQIAGTSVFKVQKGGGIVMNGLGGISGVTSVTASQQVIAGDTQGHFWTTRAKLLSPADGVVSVTNQAANGFTGLQLGPAASTSFIELQVTTQANPILQIHNANAGTTAQLQVEGTQATASGDVSLCWKTTGIFTQGAVCGTSLASHKQNIRSVVHGLDYVMRMRPVNFDWKDTGKPDLGLIADEVAAIDPLMGAYDSKTGDLYNFKDRTVLATLVKAVQELESQVKDLQAQIAAKKLAQ